MLVAVGGAAVGAKVAVAMGVVTMGNVAAVGVTVRVVVIAAPLFTSTMGVDAPATTFTARCTAATTFPLSSNTAAVIS